MAHLRNSERKVLVFGPAYLDRVIRVDEPLVDPSVSRPLDQSVDGTIRFGEGLRIVDEHGSQIEVELPPDWPGPEGTILVSRPILQPGTRRVRAYSYQDDLGGMGAGFAKAFVGELKCALGGIDDPISGQVLSLLEGSGISSSPVRIEGATADWTLLITSGVHGDKLPIGFRGCHQAWVELEGRESADLLVVAALPNLLTERILRNQPGKLRMFAPAMRNVLAQENPIGNFADAFDMIACNLAEWSKIRDSERIDASVSVVSITNGAEGSLLRFRSSEGKRDEITIPAFPRKFRPRDTNRAGESYASTLMRCLVAGGWAGGSIDADFARKSAIRASAAAALVLDRTEFGFPTEAEIDEAVAKGLVE